MRLRAAWRTFDGVRDSAAPLAPPPAERDDLAGAWRTLAAWALSEVDSRRMARSALADRVSSAEAAARAAAQAVAELFAAAGLAVPADPGAYSRAAASRGIPPIIALAFTTCSRSM